jgi:zinc protease
MKKISIPEIKSPGAILSAKEADSKYYGISFSEPLDSTVEWTLSNGAKVIWKEEKSDDKTIKMKAFRRGGLARNIDPIEFNLYNKFRLYYAVNGLERSELERWMRNNNLSLRTNIKYRTEEFGGTFEAGSEEKFFALLHHYINDVSATDKAIENIKRRILRDIETGDSEKSKYQDSVNSVKFSYYPTDVKFTEEYVNNITSEQLMNLYNTFFSNPAGYTFIFTGNLSAQKAKPLVEKFLASIPEENGHSFDATYKEPIYNKGEVYLKYEAEDMLSTKASVERIYHGEAKYTTENSLLSKFTTYILRDRYMKSIREEKGGTYYVGVTGDLSERPYSKAVFSINFDTDAPLVDELLEIVQLEIDDLIKNGPTEKEMKEIELYLKKVYKDDDKPTDWSTIIRNAILGRENITLEEEKYLDKVTPSKVKKFAKSIFTAGNKMTFIFQPE